jgi:deoxyadenosine/deoxycytidine kinase
MPNKNYILVSVDGSIGAGKSTLISRLERKLPSIEYDNRTVKILYLQEPVNLWTGGNENKINYLDLFYKNKIQVFSFEAYIMTTLLQQLKTIIEDNKNEELYVIVTERSLLSSFSVFSKLAFQNNKINASEYQILKELSELSVDIDGIIYLDCPPELCLYRIRTRGRVEEASIEINYMDALHSKYSDMLDLNLCKNFKKLNLMDDYLAEIKVGAFFYNLLSLNDSSGSYLNM